MDKSSSEFTKAKLEKFLFTKTTNIQNQDKRKSFEENSLNKQPKIVNYFKNAVLNSTESRKNQNIVDESIDKHCDNLKDSQDSPIDNFTNDHEFKNTSRENDISLLLDNFKLNLQERLEFINTIWAPDFSYNFPITTVGKKHLKFQTSWLQTWKWLSYSKIKNGAFCKYCVIFNQKEGGIGKQSLGMLCTKEFSNWKHAIEKFKNHEETGYHKTCIENYKVMSQKNYTPINIQINKVIAAEIIENRKLIMPVIESIIFCGHQGLSLRGHNDSGPLIMQHEPIENDGNFRAVLRYGLRMTSVVNSDLELIRERCKRNAQYISPKIQNEIVNICNNLILDKIVKKINSSKGFCVLADETADVAGVEQFSICARYIYNNEIKEDFLNFVPVESTTGENLAHILIKSLENFGINLQYLRGQGYDGAAAMSGRFNGVQSIIKQQYKTAVYVHCSAHVLNLVICSSCKISCIRNAMGVIESIYNFMNTPKRQCVLQSEVRNKIPNSKKEKLMKLCATRWVEKHESIRTFIDLQEAIVSSLEMMTEWVDKETSSKATQLLLSLRDTTFNVSLLVIDEIFKHSYVLCKALQRDNIDLIEAMNLAEDLTKEVKRMRQNSDEVFSNIFMTLEEKSKLLNFDIHIPRICKRQTNRYNISTDSAEEYYRISIFTPFLDYFIDQMNTRFIEHQTILKGFQSLFDNDLDKDRNDILELLHFYKESDDLSDSDIVISELKMWKNVLNRIENEQKPKRAIEFLKLCDEDLFPNVYKLLKIVCILPVTTCTSERSFSSLRRRGLRTKRCYLKKSNCSGEPF